MTDYAIHTDDKYGPLAVIEVEGSHRVRLRPHQGDAVPRGVVHKTSAPERTVVVMVEAAGSGPHR